MFSDVYIAMLVFGKIFFFQMCAKADCWYKPANNKIKLVVSPKKILYPYVSQEKKLTQSIKLTFFKKMKWMKTYK